jgi:hypothetical protein
VKASVTSFRPQLVVFERSPRTAQLPLPTVLQLEHVALITRPLPAAYGTTLHLARGGWSPRGVKSKVQHSRPQTVSPTDDTSNQ